MWTTYPSIFQLGHRYLADLFAHDVTVEEKIDGSQFSFGVVGDQLRCRSKGAEIHPDAPDKLFSKAVEVVKERADKLQPGWIYRAEYLAKPKHNVLAYDRVPANYLMIFDVTTGIEEYLDARSKRIEAERLGFEAVPLIFDGRVPEGALGLSKFNEWLGQVSVLGGPKIEGLVFKNYHAFGTDKKILIGKYVSEDFKEAHKVVWATMNHEKGDILGRLATAYKTKARWAKAVQHLRDAGKLQDAPQDIGLLIREVPDDILKECADEIKDALMAWAWPQLKRMVTGGMPEWYKEQLAAKQFGVEEGQRADS